MENPIEPSMLICKKCGFIAAMSGLYSDKFKNHGNRLHSNKEQI